MVINWNNLFIEQQVRGNGEGVWSSPCRLTKTTFVIFTCSNEKIMRVYTQIWLLVKLKLYKKIAQIITFAKLENDRRRSELTICLGNSY